MQKDSAATETLALQVSVDAAFLREGQAVEAEQVNRDQAAQSLLNEAVQIKVSGWQVPAHEIGIGLNAEPVRHFWRRW